MDVRRKALGVGGKHSSDQPYDYPVPLFTPHVSRLTPHGLGGSLTCSKMPCYGAVIFNQVKVKAKVERGSVDMVSPDLSLNLQLRARRELWRHD